MTRGTILWVLASLLALPIGCREEEGSDGDGDADGDVDGDGDSDFIEPSAGELGAPCTRNADCNSDLCLPGGRCTDECLNNDDCPRAWECGALEGAGALCLCEPSGDETCDGLDNNCNGTVDENVGCEGGLVCRGGGCTCPVEEECDGECADFTSDREHCGDCDTRCGESQICTDGECVIDCGETLTACGDQCVDLWSDLGHCGDCDTACEDGEFCVAGSCELDCDDPMRICEDLCVDVNVDERHCGGCSSPCGENQECVDGYCGCAMGYAECGADCVDTRSDARHCGECYAACDAGEECRESECHIACTGGTTECGGECVDTSSDEANCGRCGTSCGVGEACDDGVCTAQPASGGPCADSSDCGVVGGVAGECNEGTGWLDGYCLYWNLCPATGCPGDGVCVEQPSGDTVCLAACSRDSDCRDDYVCFAGPSADYCIPNCQNAPGSLCGQWSCGYDGRCSQDCWSDDDCSPGSFCSGMQCYCTEETDCGPLGYCMDGYCYVS